MSGFHSYSQDRGGEHPFSVHTASDTLLGWSIISCLYLSKLSLKAEATYIFLNLPLLLDATKEILQPIRLLQTQVILTLTTTPPELAEMEEMWVKTKRIGFRRPVEERDLHTEIQRPVQPALDLDRP